MVVPEGILVQIVLQVLGRNRMINAAYPVLSLRPKALEGVGVDPVVNINLVRMIGLSRDRIP